MNIVIVGDSWGVPNYLNPILWDNWAPEHHTEHLLKKLGYHVYNYSLNSGSNMQTMKLVDFSLRHDGVNRNKKPLVSTPPDHVGRVLEPWMAPEGVPVGLPKHVDWVIWFHTEPFRDGLVDYPNPENDEDRAYTTYTTSPYSFQETLRNRCHEVYAFAKDFFQKTGGRIAVIGGQAPIGPTVRDIFYQYITPDFIIEDWRSEILGESLECYTAISLNGHLAWALSCNDTIEEQEKLVNLQERTLLAMQDSVDFLDNAHPGAGPHARLVERLHEVFQKLP